MDKNLSQNFYDYWYVQYVLKKITDRHRLNNITTAIKALETALRGKAWTAGDYMTIADLALVSTISDIVAFEISLDACPNICNWFAKCKQVIPGYDVNEAAATELRKKFNNPLKR